MFTLTGVVIATVVALARGGRAAHAADAGLLWPGVLLAAVLIDFATRFAGPGGPDASPNVIALLVLYQGLVLAVILVNVLRRGMPIVALGASLNAVAALSNGGMPVSSGAVRWLGASPDLLLFQDSHHLVTASTRLVALTDIIPVPVLRTVVSLGDVVVLAGLAIVIDELLRPDLGSPRAPRSA